MRDVTPGEMRDGKKASECMARLRHRACLWAQWWGRATDERERWVAAIRRNRAYEAYGAVLESYRDEVEAYADFPWKQLAEPSLEDQNRINMAVRDAARRMLPLAWAVREANFEGMMPKPEPAPVKPKSRKRKGS